MAELKSTRSDSPWKADKRHKANGRVQVRWYDAAGKRKYKTLPTSSMADANRFLVRVRSQVLDEQQGFVDVKDERVKAESNKLITDLVESWKAAIQQDAGAAHAANFTRCVRQAAHSAGWMVLADIDADGMIRVKESLLSIKRSARTIQEHVRACKSFTKWCVQTGRLKTDPLQFAKAPDPSTDRRHVRRYLLHDEWPILREATANGKTRRAMSGAERALLYELAVVTGYRSNELRSLRSNSLKQSPNGWQLTTGETKNGQPAYQGISNDLATRLKSHCRGKTPKASMFNLPDKWAMPRMLRSDLKAAREAWLADAEKTPGEYAKRLESDFLTAENHDGQVIDFHALRHTCGAWLALAGVHIKTIQRVMRHSDIKLTLDTYGHLLPNALEDATAALGRMAEAPHLRVKA